MTQIEMAQCAKSLSDIYKLEDNWNENGSCAFSKEIIEKVSLFLKYSLYMPFISPTACNSIQLDYKNDNNEHLEVEISEDIEVFIVLKDKTETEYKYKFDEFYKVLNLIKIFYNGFPKNVVLFTGAFNPPTIAHYHMVHSVLRNENTNFDYVVFALSSKTFLEKKQQKNNDWCYSESERLKLVLTMIAHNKNALLFGIETGYTYQVLCDVKKEFNCDNLYFACGSDKLNEIERWGYAKKLLTEFDFYVLMRGKETEEEIKKECDRIFSNTKYVLAKDNEKYKDISATQVRKNIKNGKICKALLEKHVYEYLKGVNKW